MTAVTLNAGDVFGFVQGYARPGSSIGSSAGSVSGQPLVGQTIDLLLTGGTAALALVGDTTGLGPLTLTVNGVSWPVSSGAYQSGSNTTEYTITPSGGGFANGVNYTVDLTAGGGPPPANTTAFFAFI